MSGSYSRNKGRRLEQQAVLLFKRFGLPAKRISMMESNHEDTGDVLLNDEYKVEVKGGAQVPKWIYNVMKEKKPDMLVFKRDREKWLVCMDLEKFIEEFYYSIVKVEK